MAELKQLKQLVEATIQEEVNLTVDKMVKLVGDRYNIDKREIYDLLQEFQKTTESEPTEIVHGDLVINTNKCLGKTKFGTQCSRSRLGESDFCGNHNAKLPYGRIDDQIDEGMLKKRGRPKKD